METQQQYKSLKSHQDELEAENARLIWWPKELPVPCFVGSAGSRKIARWSLPSECLE